ncbi:hypothetical protein MOSE0_H09670 [Monosporozyma servazzii]
MLTINERFCVIDGWIVDIEEMEVVSQKFTRSLFTADEKRKLAEVGGLKAFSDIDTSSTMIVNSTSEELFHYVKTEDVEFVTIAGRVVAKNNKTYRHSRKSVNNEFTLKCHPITVGRKIKCYLHLTVPNRDTQLQSSTHEIPVKHRTEGSSFFTNIVKVQELKFTRDDYNILKNLVLQNESHAKYIAGDMMKILKEQGSIKTIGVFGRSIYRGGDRFIKVMLPETLATVGSRISYLLLLLKCCDKLSVFSKYKSTADRIAGTITNCNTATQLAEVIAKEVSVVSEDGGDTEFWKTWVFLGAFDFSSWGSYDHICPCVSIFDYKHLLESLLWVFRCGGVIYGEDKQAVVERWTPDRESGIPFVDHIKNLYTHAIDEADVSALALASVRQEEQYVTVKNRVLSYRIIGGALNDLTDEFDGSVEELSQWLSFGNPDQLYSITIGSHGKTFEDDQSAVNILHNFGRDAFQSIKMRWRVPGDKNDANILKRIKDIIADLNKLIMAIGWISTGMPMRYAELATLTYAGQSRNIYIDEANKRLYLNIKYKKNQKFIKRSLFLTDGVSRRLWWTIAILRTFAFVTFYDEIGEYDERGVIDELYREVSDDVRKEDLALEDEDTVNDAVAASDEFLRQVKEDISTGSDTTASVPKIFAFVDIKSHRLFKLQQVRDVLKVTKHRTKPSYQNMSALWKTFIIPKLNLDDGNISDVIDSRDSLSAVSKVRELTFSEMAAAHALFQKAIGLPG